MTVQEKLYIVTDVAFNNNIRKVKKVSYDKLIDIQYGVYIWTPIRGEEAKKFDGCLTINFKPTHGWKDWAVNLFALPVRYGDSWVHAGYYNEFKKYLSSIIFDIHKNDTLLSALQKGIIISGKSKGAAECILFADYYCRVNGGTENTLKDKVLVGAIEPPRAFGSKLSKEITQRFDIVGTIYHNDIVPGLPFWFKLPDEMVQLGKRRLGLSIKDHQKSTEDEEYIYKELLCLT